VTEYMQWFINLMDPEPCLSGFHTSVYTNHWMSLVFRVNSIKLYLDVDRGFGDSLTQKFTYIDRE